MDAIPPDAQRELVDAQRPRVEQAVELDRAEVRRAQRAELLGAVLAQVPRIARALGALGRQRQHVGRRHERGAAGAQHALDVLEHAVGVLDVLDRLQEDDGVARLGVRLDHVAREAQVGRAVAQPRVLVGVGVGVDADHAVGAARQHVGAVALAAREVDDAHAADAPRDPLVDDQMAAEPVVLLRDVGQRALAVERERRHAGRLVALQEEVGHEGRAG